MPGGRPPYPYSDELADYICAQLALGRPLIHIVRDDGMPSITTVYKWLDERPSFARMYARAREDQADTLADEILAISDDSSADAEIDESGRRRMDAEFVARSRLRVDARKWIAAKLKPRKYGDRIEQAVTVTTADMTDEQIAQRLASLGVNIPD